MKQILTVVVAGTMAVAAWGVTTEPIAGGGTALVVSGAAFDADEKAALNGNTVTELWKTGSGTLEAEGISSFTGIIRVKGGVYAVAAQAGLGTTAGATYVENGATLEMTGKFSCTEPLYIEGRGPGGTSHALRLSSNTSGARISGLLTLTGDASIWGYKEVYFSTTIFDMGWHTLTFENETHQWVGMISGSVVNPGHMVVAKGQVWFSNSGIGLDHGPEYTITATNNANVSMYYNTKKFNWKLRWYSTNSNGLYCQCNRATPVEWHGPIEIGAGYNLNLTVPNVAEIGPSVARLYGPISGEGALSIVGPGQVYLYGTNTYSGTTKLTTQSTTPRCVFMRPEAMPPNDPSLFTRAGTDRGHYAIWLKADDETDAAATGWTAADVAALNTRFADSSLPIAYLGADAASEYTVTHPLTRGECLADGAGKVRFTGVCAENREYSFRSLGEGEYVLGGENVATAANFVPTRVSFLTGGRWRFEDFGTWLTAAGQKDEPGYRYADMKIAASGAPSRVTLGRGTLITCTDQATVPSVTTSIYVGYSDNCRGILEIEDGAAVTNRLCVGNYASSPEENLGALFQRGGDVYLTNAGSNDGYVGYTGYGFYGNYGGRLTIRGWTRIGNGTNGAGIYHGANDATVKGASLVVAASGTGLVYQTAGTLHVTSSTAGALSVCNASWAPSQSGGFGNLAVCGSTAVVSLDYDAFYMADTSDSQSFVNLLEDGTFRGCNLKKSGAVSNRGQNVVNARGYINFNGGVYRANGRNAKLFGADDKAPDRVTVYTGGATFDTDGKNAEVNASLQAPTGMGVTAIALPAEDISSSYEAPPLVRIEGDGTGATAVAEFDVTTRRVTGIKVTSPGWGYSSATAHLHRGGCTTNYACAVTLGADTGLNGLVKKGAGTLTLSCANTYAGPTTVEAGTLHLAAAGAIPAGSEVVVKGGCVTAAEGVALPTAFTFGVENPVDGTTYTVVDYGTVDKVPSSLPTVNGLEDMPSWAAVVRGAKLVVKRVHGTSIMFK